MAAPPPRKLDGWRRWLTIAAGWAFILLGILGLFLPVLQGILFLVIGVLLLASASYRVRRWLVLLRRRYPVIGGHIDKGRRYLRNKARQWRTRGDH